VLEPTDFHIKSAKRLGSVSKQQQKHGPVHFRFSKQEINSWREKADAYFLFRRPALLALTHLRSEQVKAIAIP